MADRRLLLLVLVASLLGGPRAAEAMDVGWSRVTTGDLAYGARDVAQDDGGILWFATEVGLVRFDGERTLAFHPDDQRIAVWRVVFAVGQVWAATRAGVVYVVRDGRLVRALDEDGAPLLAGALAGEPDALWVWSRTGLRVLDGDGGWTRVSRDEREREHVFHLRPGHGGVYVASTHGLSHATRAGEVAVRPGLTVDVVPLDGGGLAVQARDLVLIDGDEERVLVPHQNSRAMSLIARDGVLYLTYDKLMFRVTTDGYVSTLRSRQDGGPPLTDNAFVAADGTLWLGAVRLMEPETRLWSVHDGQPRMGRYVTVAPDDTAFVSTWTGDSRLSRTGPLPDASISSGRDRMNIVCLGAAGGALSFVGRRGIVDVESGELVVPDVRGSGCGPAQGGGVWMLGRGGLWEVREGEAYERVRPPVAVFRGIVETDDGALIAVGGTTVCEASAEAVRAGEPEPWTCVDLPPRVGPNLVCAFEAEPGLVWLCSEGDGVWERSEAHRWSASRVNDVLPVRGTTNARRSPRGGVWLVGGGQAVRVESHEGVWSVVERVDEHVGVSGSVADVDEDSEGNLWLATWGGAGWVPAARRAREAELFPPRLVGATVDGEPATEPFLVPSGGAAELQFAALAYRHPESLRYRWRLGGGAWSSASPSGTIRLAGLASGAVGLEVATTVAADRWSAPLRVDLRVLPPWYQRPWFWFLVLAVFGAGAYSVGRIRARIALAAEQQRSRIAMDLHDELGAGLGSISILAGLLTSDRVPAENAREAARRIAASAEELGGSVTDIVWSLRSEGHDLTGLVVYLRERAAMLLDRETVAFRAEADGLEQVPLSAPLARALQMVLVEALYNTARHAGATEVVLRAAVQDGACELSLSDNGSGVARGPATRPGGGSGLRNMKRRADEVGAALTIEAGPEGGTVVRVRFGV